MQGGAEYVMFLLFWFGVIWLSYVYVGYPLALWLISWVRRVNPKAAEGYVPSVSVLISARNEEKDIGWKVRETLQWNYPPDRLEVIVASDASNDLTDEILKGILDPRFVFLRMEKRGGKNVALNRMAELARGQVLFFTDANSHIEPDCLRQMVRYFADERVGCVTGHTGSVQQEGDPALGSGARTYWGYEALISQLESCIGAVLVCDGAIFCLRRSLYLSLHPELANDLELPLRIAHAGFWILFEPSALVLEDETSSPAEEFDRRRRICAQGMLGMWKLWGTLQGIRRWEFVSHKFLRWLTLIPLIFVLVSSAVLVNKTPFAVLLGLQVLFYSLGVLGWALALWGRSVGSLVSVPFYVLLVGAAGLVGVVETCFGRRFTVWEIPALARGRRKGKWQSIS